MFQQSIQQDALSASAQIGQYYQYQYQSILSSINININQYYHQSSNTLSRHPHKLVKLTIHIEYNVIYIQSIQQDALTTSSKLDNIIINQYFHQSISISINIIIQYQYQSIFSSIQQDALSASTQIGQYHHHIGVEVCCKTCQ